MRVLLVLAFLMPGAAYAGCQLGCDTTYSNGIRDGDLPKEGQEVSMSNGKKDAPTKGEPERGHAGAWSH